MDADSPSSFPQDNEAAEASLRDSLRALSKALPLDARAEIDTLEAAHGRRRYGVWATLGQAPLAVAIEHPSIYRRWRGWRNGRSAGRRWTLSPPRTSSGAGKLTGPSLTRSPRSRSTRRSWRWAPRSPPSTAPGLKRRRRRYSARSPWTTAGSLTRLAVR